MSVRSRLLRVAVPALMVLSLTSGCGGTDDTSSSGSTGSGTGDSGGTGTGTGTESGTTSSPSDDTGGAGSPCADKGDFTESFTPPDWTASFIDVCVTPNRASVLVTNTSAYFLQLQGLATTALRPMEAASADFTSSVNSAVAADLDSQNLAWKALPPGATIIGDAAPPAAGQVQVSMPLVQTAGAYAASVLSSWVQSKLTSPDQQLAQRVGECAGEVAQTWNKADNYGSAQLPQLLADTTLGAGLSCGSLIKDVTSEAGDAEPEESRLGSEFADFGEHVKATAFDDLAGLVREGITVAARR